MKKFIKEFSGLLALTITGILTLSGTKTTSDNTQNGELLGWFLIGFIILYGYVIYNTYKPR